MDCTLPTAAHEVVCIAQGVSVTDWLIPLLAALVGGLIGAAALWLVYSGEKRERERAALERRAERQREADERQEERFEEALASLMRAMSAKADAIRSHPMNAMGHNLPMRGEDWTISSALDVALMLATDGQREYLSPLPEVIAMSAALSGTGSEQAADLSASVAAIRIWRTGELAGARMASDWIDRRNELLRRASAESRNA